MSECTHYIANNQLSLKKRFVYCYILHFFALKSCQSVPILSHYRKAPKLLDAKNVCCKLPYIQTKWPNLRLFCQNGAKGIANSEDPVQTDPLGAV